MDKEYDLYGRQYKARNFTTNCVCISSVVKGTIMRALVTREAQLANEIKEQAKFITDIATKGAEEAGKANPDFNIVEFTRAVVAGTEGGPETPQEEATRLREFALGVSDFKKNQWELYEAVRKLIRNVPTCKGEEPPMNVNWKPPRYRGYPWEEKGN